MQPGGFDQEKFMAEVRLLQFHLYTAERVGNPQSDTGLYRITLKSGIEYPFVVLLSGEGAAYLQRQGYIITEVRDDEGVSVDDFRDPQRDYVAEAEQHLTDFDKRMRDYNKSVSDYDAEREEWERQYQRRFGQPSSEPFDPDRPTRLNPDAGQIRHNTNLPPRGRRGPTWRERRKR